MRRGLVGCVAGECNDCRSGQLPDRPGRPAERKPQRRKRTRQGSRASLKTPRIGWVFPTCRLAAVLKSLTQRRYTSYTARESATDADHGNASRGLVPRLAVVVDAPIPAEAQRRATRWPWRVALENSTGDGSFYRHSSELQPGFRRSDRTAVACSGREAPVQRPASLRTGPAKYPGLRARASRVAMRLSRPNTTS